MNVLLISSCSYTGGVTYFPNGLSQPDRRNNAERVIINGVSNNAVATITVTAYNLARYEQKYSLVGKIRLLYSP